jgi:uncharacterized protein
VRLRVRVTPRSSRDAIEGFDVDGILRVRVRAAPVDGAANEAVIRLLAKAAGIPQSAVTLHSGASSRTKAFELPIEEAELRRRLGAAG